MTKYYDDDCDQYDHDGKENKKKEHKETQGNITGEEDDDVQM